MNRYLKWGGIIFITAIIIFLIRLPRMVEEVAVNRLERSFGRKIETGPFKYNYFRNILYIDNFKIYEDDGERVFASFDSFNVNIEILPILRRDFYIKELTLENPNLRIEYVDGIPNFRSIIESIGREEKEQAAGVEEEGYFRMVELKNVTINSFILQYEDKIIKAENDFTLESPDIYYERGNFNFSSKINFKGEGSLQIDMVYSDTKDYEGRLILKRVDLGDKLYILKSNYKLDDIEGVVSADLEFSGNTVENILSLRGVLSGDDILVKSTEYGELVSLQGLAVDIDEISTGSRNYYFKEVNLDTGRTDVARIMEYKEGMWPAKPDEREEEPIDIRVDRMAGRDMDILTGYGHFQELNLILDGFKNEGREEFVLDASGRMDEGLEFDLKSRNILKEGLNITGKTIKSTGTLEVKGGDFEPMRRFLPEDRDYEIEMKEYEGEIQYTYEYPKIGLDTKLKAMEVALDNMAVGYEKIGLGNPETDHEFDYDMDSGEYSISGDITGDYLDIEGTELILRGEEISLTGAGIDPEKYTGNLKALKANMKGDFGEISGREISLSSADIEGSSYRVAEGTLKDLSVVGDFGELGIAGLATEGVDIGNGTAGTEDSSMNYRLGTLSMTSFSLKNNKAKDMITIGSFSGSKLDIGEESYRGGDIDIRGVLIDLINLQGDSGGEEDSSLLPLILVDSLRGRDVRIRDERFLLDVDIDTDNIGNLRGSSRVDLRGTYNDTSQISLKGTLRRTRDIRKTDQYKDIEFIGKSGVKAFDMSWLASYTEEEYGFKGILNLDSEITYVGERLDTVNFIYLEGGGITLEEASYDVGNFLGDGSISYAGDVYQVGGKYEINKFSAKSGDTDFHLEEGDIVLNLVTPKKIDIESINLVKPLVVIRGEEESKDVTKEEMKKEAEDQREKPMIYVKRFNIEDGEVKYRSKNLNYNIRDIIVETDDFVTEKNRKFKGKFSADLTGTGRLDGYFVSSLEKTGDLEAKYLNLDGAFNIKNLDLLDFRDYLVTKLPYEIDSGKLSYEGTVNMDNGKFRGENLIVIETISIGDKTQAESAVPLKLAVSILKDRKGNLTLDVPVSGDFNDPDFKIYRVVLQAIKNILIRAATSPVNILGRAFHIGDSKVVALDYSYLSPTPVDRDMKKLSTLAELLDEKSSMKAVLTVFTNREQEKKLLNEKLREEKIFKRDTKDEDLEKGVDELMLQRKKYLEEYFRKKLLEDRVRVEISDLSREEPTVGIDFSFE